MKKIVIYVFLIIGICFLIPIFFTTKFKIKKKNIEEPPVLLDIEKYNYTDFETIKLLHKITSLFLIAFLPNIHFAATSEQASFLSANLLSIILNK